MQIKYWVMAIRPKTLSIAFVPVLVGSSLAWSQTGQVDWLVIVAALTSATLIQVGTNLHNDAADFERGTDDPTTRLGPPRATAEGWLTADQVRDGAKLSFSLAGIVGSYLIWVGGWPIAVVGVTSIAAGVAYTGGPRPIAYTGFGEFFVLVFFGLVAVTAIYYLHAREVTLTAMLVGIMVGMPAAAVLVVNNYRDLDNDRRAGKKTLAVRLGRPASRMEYALLMFLPFVVLCVLPITSGVGWWLALPLFCLPSAGLLVRRFRRESSGPGFNQILASTAKFQLAYSVLLSVGLLLARYVV